MNKYNGEGKYPTTVEGKRTKAYSAWCNMFTRAYSKAFHKRKPTYIGCSVSEEWFNFQVFAEWYSKRYFKGASLDKDIKYPGNKLYSPDTCMLVTVGQNTIAAKAMNWNVVSPSGELHEVYNLSEFCRNNELDQGTMSRVCSGRIYHHKGWTKYVR